MSIKALKAKLIALHNEQEQMSQLARCTRSILHEIEKCPKNKQQLIRNLEVNHRYAGDVLKYLLSSALWDLKH